MAPKIIQAPRDSEECYEVASTIVDVGTAALPADVLADLRRALARADDTADIDDVELRRDARAARARITAALTAGTINVAQARAELLEARQRADVDTELADMIKQVRGRRLRGAWEAVRKVDWDAVQETGRAAARSVRELAAEQPANASIDASAKANAAFVKAVDTWLSAASVLLEVRRWAGLPHDPLAMDEMHNIPAMEWRFGGKLGALAVPSNVTGNVYEVAIKTVQAGGIPWVCDPVDIDARFEHRAKMTDIAQSYFRAGWSDLPGVHIAVDQFHFLPKPARELLPDDWPQVVTAGV